jgi:uncharacterized membrane protein YheB (UPF0754 family)
MYNNRLCIVWWYSDNNKYSSSQTNVHTQIKEQIKERKKEKNNSRKWNLHTKKKIAIIENEHKKKIKNTMKDVYWLPMFRDFNIYRE